jgi:hypothetical protein
MHYNNLIMNKLKNSGAKPQKLTGILLNLLEAYVFWQTNSKHIPKMLRHSMGVRIDCLFAEMSELISTAMFAPLDKRLALVDKTNTKNDVLKFMLYALFELDGLKEEFFDEISLKMEEIGKRLYGWKMKIQSESLNGSTTKPVEPLAKDRK